MSRQNRVHEPYFLILYEMRIEFKFNIQIYTIIIQSDVPQFHKNGIFARKNRMQSHFTYVARHNAFSFQYITDVYNDDCLVLNTPTVRHVLGSILKDMNFLLSYIFFNQLGFILDVCGNIKCLFGDIFFTLLFVKVLCDIFGVFEMITCTPLKKSFVRRYHTLSPCIFCLCLISFHACYATDVQQLLDIFSAQYN